MRLPSIPTLCGLGALIGVVGVGGVILVQKSKMDEISTSPYFREAFKILRAHKGAVTLMGEPIKQLGFDQQDRKNWCDGARAKFHVRVKGPKDRGQVYFWATTDTDQKWNINRVELELKSQPTRRLVIKDGPYDPEDDPEDTTQATKPLSFF